MRPANLDAVSSPSVPAASSSVDGSSRLPLSAAQQEIWLAHQLDLTNPRYNCGGYLELDGAIDGAALARAVQQAVDECEALRVRFGLTAEGPAQWITPLVAPLHRLDLRDAPDPRGAAEDWMRGDLGRAVALVDGALFTHAWLRIADDRSWFYLRYHHILLDGFGQILYWRRLAAIYTALVRGEAPPPTSFASLAALLADEQAYRQSPQHGVDREFWEQAMAAPAQATGLGSRTTAEVARDVRFRRFTLPAEVAARLQRAATAHHTYGSVVALAVVGVYVHRLTQAGEVVLGLPVLGRAGRRALRTPAMLANELPLRLQLSPDMPFGDVVRQVAAQVSAALRHQRYRGEDVQRHQRRLHGASAPHAVVVNVVSFDGNLDFAGCPATSHALSSGPVRDLQIEVFGGGPGSGLEVCFKANAELHTAASLAAHHRRFLHVLDVATGDVSDVAIGRLPLIPDDEAAWIRGALIGPVRAYDLARGLHDQIDDQARRTPAAIAIETATTQLTYAALIDAADRLAAELVRRGVSPGEPVGVHDVRSPELMVSLLAVLKAGGAYLPLDPELPASRLAYQVGDAALRVVLTRSTHAAQLAGCAVDLLCVDAALSGLPAAAPWTGRAAPDSPAYVLYTSGSTGQPKAVRVPHRGILNRLWWMQEAYGLTADDCVLQKTPFTFDVSGWELFWPLLVGARLFLAEPGQHRDPRYVAQVIAERGITTLHFVPPMLDLFLAEPAAAALAAGEPGERSRLRRVFCSGEALRAETVRAFFDRYGGGVELHNLYGPTEASIDVTSWPCRASDASQAIPIGRPVANTQLFLLDPGGEPTPAGAPGELYIAGVQVALGYLHRPELTAARFVANRFGDGRMYRTGDLARLRADGAIEYLGRTDDQVKIRGNRVELAEVESALLAHPGVDQAAVIAPAASDGQRHILAYVVAAAPLDAAQITQALRDRLPGYMVPAQLIQLAALPMAANGKLDRKALPLPSHGDAAALDKAMPAAASSASASSATPATPATPDEQLVQRVWAQVLRIASPGPALDASFFALGGDSMSAIQIRAGLERHGKTFAIDQLFEGRTIRELAAAMRPVRDAHTRGAGVRTAPFSLVSPADRARLPDGLDDAYPLSAMQAGMLYHAAHRARSSLYRVVTSVVVTGALDLGALHAAVTDLARRHPSLRCSFDLTRYTEPLQLVNAGVTVPVIVADDLGALADDAQRAHMAAWIDQVKHTEFDLTVAPLLRFVVHPSGPGRFRLSVIEHHVVLDGWSDMRMLEEVVRRYRARLAGEELWLPGIASTYRDFVAAERRAIADPASRAYWTALLRGAEPSILPRTQAPGDHASRRFGVPISAAHAAKLRALARREGLPFKALLTAAHVAVLRAITGRDDVVTGVIAHARLEEAGGDDVIGVFLNTLPLRLDVGESSILETAHQIFAAEKAARPHRGYPLAQMQRDLGEALQLDSYVNFMDFHVDRAQLARDGMAFEAGVAETNYALAVDFLIDPDRDALVLWLDCDLGALGAPLCERLVGYYERALGHAADAPDARIATLDLRGAGERALMATWNATETAYDATATIPALIARQAAATPGAIALVHGFTETCYAALEARASQLAHHLCQRGIGRGDRVGVRVRRGADLVIAMLGVMKAGAAYVPMDPAFPPGRLALIQRDAQLAGLVTADAGDARGTSDDTDGVSGLRTLLVDVHRDRATLAALPTTAPALALTGDDVAYVIYTSGSTGRPKGTAVRHRNVANFFVAMDARVGCDARDVVVAMTSVSFDISALELLWPLTHGARVVVGGEDLVHHLVPRDDAAETPHAFTALCARHHVTLLQGTPSLLTAIAAEPRALEALRGARALLVGGEAFPAGLADRLARALPATRILNMYGPTETTIWSTTHELDGARDPGGGTISIGRPIANTTLHILDHHGQPAPIGVPGELWIGGDGVAVGYLHQPALTAERFVDHPVHGRCYRTGDRTRWRGDGTVDFLGRMDRQVKILGHRVEPDEIESVLSRHPEIEAVAVVARAGASGTELVAYVSPARTVVTDPSVEETFVRRWGELWQETYAGAPAIGAELAGWTSSYDGRPIPAPQMREWLDHTVARIRGLGPRAVADIGVGVGLILRELAAHTELYHGVDISPAALAAAAACLGPGRALPAHVHLAHAGPEYLASLPAASLDVVVLNSVVQYFPSIGYLRKVIGDAVRVVRPGGAIYIGDVRALEMLPELQVAVQLHRAPALQTVDELRAVVTRQLADERELCISPQFFRGLAAELPALREVRLELKRGRADNELTQFRYDASLIVGAPVAASPPARIAYAECNGLDELGARLAGSAGPLLVAGIPNRRLSRAARATQLLRELPCEATAWDLDRLLWEVDETQAVHPEDLISLAARAGHDARVIVASDGRLESFDAMLVPRRRRSPTRPSGESS